MNIYTWYTYIYIYICVYPWYFLLGSCSGPEKVTHLARGGEVREDGLKLLELYLSRLGSKQVLTQGETMEGHGENSDSEFRWNLESLGQWEIFRIKIGGMNYYTIFYAIYFVGIFLETYIWGLKRLKKTMLVFAGIWCDLSMSDHHQHNVLCRDFVQGVGKHHKAHN